MKNAAKEASSSRPKRQKLHSVFSFVEDKKEVVTGSGSLYELDLLDCPICCHAMSTPIFQNMDDFGGKPFDPLVRSSLKEMKNCENGHIACWSCCDKMCNKCPCCALPIGKLRCRIMERVINAVFVPCPHAKYGCNEEFTYGKVLDHEKICDFSPLRCPAPNCNYSGALKDLFDHYYANHKNALRRFFLNQ